MGRHCIDRQIVSWNPDKLFFDAMKNFYCKQKQNQENSVKGRASFELYPQKKETKPFHKETRFVICIQIASIDSALA